MSTPHPDCVFAVHIEFHGCDDRVVQNCFRKSFRLVHIAAKAQLDCDAGGVISPYSFDQDIHCILRCRHHGTIRTAGSPAPAMARTPRMCYSVERRALELPAEAPGCRLVMDSNASASQFSVKIRK
eukprot:m.285458 g.285458  ORF g.285458 m.285458 type:complete len:126 (-) comp16205_c0_seq3:308-685(-)